MAGFNSISSEPRNDSRYISLLKKGLNSVGAEHVKGTYIGLQKGLNSVAVARPLYLVPSVTLTDKLAAIRDITGSVQVSNAKLYIAASAGYTMYPRDLTFPQFSLTAVETNFHYALEREHIRLRCDISYTDPRTGNTVTEHLEDLRV